MSRQDQFMEALFTRYRWVLHLIFWIAVLAFYVLFFGRRTSNYVQTMFFVGLLMPVTIATTYLLNYYLVPRYLLRGRYGFFLLYFGYTLVASLFLELTIAMLTFLVMAGQNTRNMSPASIDIFFLLASLLVVVFLGVAVKMLLYWRTARLDNEVLVRQKLETELKFLKVQLNPHFLFNTLNNLYYLTSQKSDKAPQAILQLSEVLDYVIHQSQHTEVPLPAELQQVDNYIELELLRYGDRVTVEKEVSGDPSLHTIGPMLLITLMENAFKHGVMNSTGSSWIRFGLDCTSDRVEVHVSNSRTSSVSGSGIGLANLKSQLMHLYGERHSLVLSDNLDQEFSVTLSIHR
jgi:LytS/YehU family sensor histidine kinase